MRSKKNCALARPSTSAICARRVCSAPGCPLMKSSDLKDHIVFIEEVVEHAVEEELCSGPTKHLRHLRPESMFCAWMPINEIFHVHPAAWAGSSQANLFPFSIDNVTAADAKELHFVVAARSIFGLWAGGLFRCSRRAVSRERCRASQRGHLKKLAPRVQFGCYSPHKSSFENLV